MQLSVGNGTNKIWNVKLSVTHTYICMERMLKLASNMARKALLTWSSAKTKTAVLVKMMKVSSKAS